MWTLCGTIYLQTNAKEYKLHQRLVLNVSVLPSTSPISCSLYYMYYDTELLLKQKINVSSYISGWLYYFFSNALYDHNTAHKTGVYSMQDSNMVFCEVPHFLMPCAFHKLLK